MQTNQRRYAPKCGCVSPGPSPGRVFRQKSPGLRGRYCGALFIFADKASIFVTSSPLCTKLYTDFVPLYRDYIPNSENCRKNFLCIVLRPNIFFCITKTEPFGSVFVWLRPPCGRSRAAVCRIKEEIITTLSFRLSLRAAASSRIPPFFCPAPLQTGGSGMASPLESGG